MHTERSSFYSASACFLHRCEIIYAHQYKVNGCTDHSLNPTSFHMQNGFSFFLHNAHSPYSKLTNGGDTIVTVLDIRSYPHLSIDSVQNLCELPYSIKYFSHSIVMIKYTDPNFSFLFDSTMRSDIVIWVWESLHDCQMKVWTTLSEIFASACIISCFVFKCHFILHFICHMTRQLLKENRVFLSSLLEENNAVKFEQLLYEYPSYIHMHCNEYDGVSFLFALLMILDCMKLFWIMLKL